MKHLSRRTFLSSSLLLLAGGYTRAQDTEIDIYKEFKSSAAIPLSVTGYSGEVDHVLKFDLEVAGFEIVAPDAAVYNVSGNNASAVEGQVVERATKIVRLGNTRYSGGTPRSQAHAFSDDIVLKLTGKPGIARTKIAFKGQNGSDSEIYVADYDGANAMAVTSDHALVAAPCWVPGHFMLYYTSYKSGFADVYAQNLSTGQRRVVSKYPGLNSSAAVSPDGRQVALILSKSGSPDLFVIDAEGGNPRQLTKTREDESSPCWSPDGKSICFCSRLGGSPALYTISPEGGRPKRLHITGGSSLTEPDWSPDGKMILFTAIRRSGFDLCMVPKGGGEATVLTSGSDGCWAPNSRTVVFTRQEKGRQILSLLDVPTKRVKDVAHNLGSCSQPSWAK
jgi:TolB protein